MCMCRTLSHSSPTKQSQGCGRCPTDSVLPNLGTTPKDGETPWNFYRGPWQRREHVSNKHGAQTNSQGQCRPQGTDCMLGALGHH